VFFLQRVLEIVFKNIHPYTINFSNCIHSDSEPEMFRCHWSASKFKISTGVNKISIFLVKTNGLH